MKLLVRNGDAANPRTGVDWRAVAPLGMLALAITSGSATLAVNLLSERAAVLQHVSRGDALMRPVEDHLRDREAHLSEEEATALSVLPNQLSRIESDIDEIKSELKSRRDWR